MKILVTGGAGFIGSALVTLLLHADHTVRVLDREPPHARQAGFEYVQDDLVDAEKVARVLVGIEVVYHLAWAFHPEDGRREVEENLLGTLNLLKASTEAGVGHFIFASSAVVYGPTGERPVSENDPCHPEQTTIGGPAYGITKLACEGYCLAAQRNGPAVTILRLHGVFHEARLGQFSPMFEQAAEGRDLTAIAEAGGQYAHLDNVTWAMREVLGRDESLGEVFNVAGQQVYHDAMIAEYIAKRAGTGSRVVLQSNPSQAMISVSINKLTRTIGYRPRKRDFLRDLIDARFS